MKNDPITALLLAILFACGAAACALSYQYSHAVSTIQTLQRQRIQFNRDLSVFQALLNDAVEYGKKNPSFETALQSMWPKQAKPATNSIPAKP